MRNFQKIAENVPVTNALHQLLRLGGPLWNEHKFRTTYEGTPHIDVDDIWLRFSSLEACYGPAPDSEKLVVGEVIEDTKPIWYPAAKILTETKNLVLNLGRAVDAYELGRLLITRIKPGGRILPHSDTDGAYVKQGDIARYHTVLSGRPGSIFRCGDEQVAMLSGEVYWFDASKEHEVLNGSDTDRIHLIADYRCW